MFSISFRKHRDEKKENTDNFDCQSANSLSPLSLRQQLMLVLCLHQVVEHDFNQSVHIFS